MKHKILLPTDFSENAWQAINYALELYKNEDCDFYILNVFSATGNILASLLNTEPGSGLYNAAKEQSEKGLSNLLDALILKDNGDKKHQFKTISQFNNIIEAIKQIVAQKDIEMIVMGTKGATYSKAKAFGSTATYVMEKVRNCPVIVVPQNAKKVLPKEIVFPTSYKTHYKRRELNYLTNLAKKCEATIAVLHISDVNELSIRQKENKQLLEDILEGTSFKFYALSHNDVETALNIFVESRDSDMVAFINKKHAFFGSILSNPMVKDISFHSKVPILVMHDLRN